MILAPFRWLWRHLATLLLAFALGLLVWISAVSSADPNEECATPRILPLTVLGQDPAYLVLGSIPENISVRLEAPRSLCVRLSDEPSSVSASLDLSGLGEGEHTIEIDLQISPAIEPIRVVEVSPRVITFSLEEFTTRTLPLQPEIIGQPAPGYTAGLAILSDSRVLVSGRKSLVESIDRATVTLDITDTKTELNVSRGVLLLDENGELVTGVGYEPTSVNIRQIIERPGTFRDVSVRVIYEGQPAEGYFLTGITTSPQVVTVFSSNPDVIREMPAFVETTSIDLSGATDDLEQRVTLLLPEGVSIDGSQFVLVQISIAAIESSITLSLPLEPIGLSEFLKAIIEPATVDVILSGPLPILERLQPLDVQIVLDLVGLGPGQHILLPQIEILQPGIQVESLIPASVEVSLELLPTSTPTQELTGTPDLTGTPAANPTATPTP